MLILLEKYKYAHSNFDLQEEKGIAFRTDYNLQEEVSVLITVADCFGRIECEMKCLILQIFNYFTRCMEAQIRSAQQEGRFNEGLVDIMATSVKPVGPPKEIFKSANTAGNNPTK